MKTDKERKEANDESAQGESTLFRVSPEALGAVLTSAAYGPIDFSWLNSVFGTATQSAANLEWLKSYGEEIAAARVNYAALIGGLRSQLPSHKEMLRAALSISTQVRGALAGLEGLRVLLRSADVVGHRAAIAALMLQAIANDDRPTIEAPDVEM